MSGRLIAVVGPSGAGKDTLIAGAVAARPDLLWVRRAITRPESAGGEPFEGVTREEFERRRAAGGFLFWWEAHGLLYGIPAAVEADLARGRTVIFNASRGTLDAVRARFPELEVIAVTAPADVLARRLAARGREDDADIRARVARAAAPLPGGARTVMNDGTVAEGISRMLEAIGGDAPAVTENRYGPAA